MRVNGGQSADVRLKGSGHGSTRVPVELNQGNNSIAFRFTGQGSVGIDRLVLNR
jgi:hypothetical protein